MAMTDIDQGIDERGINVIRGLSMDAVQKANSGHPGTPMALAPLAHVLWTRVMKYDAAAPDWPDRDRFVLSNGHASMLLYSMLYLTGFGLDARRPRASSGSGARRRRATPSTATPPASRSRPVRSARASPTRSASRSPRPTCAPGSAPRSSTTTSFAICSDGDLEEGVSHEAASLAGHLGLGRLVYVYDDNHITIDGPTELAYSDDVPERFEGYGWHVVELGEVANDLDALEAGLREGMAETGATEPARAAQPHRLPVAEVHRHREGARQPARRRRGRRGQGDPRPPARRDFYVPDDVLEYYRAAGTRGARRARGVGAAPGRVRATRSPRWPTSTTPAIEQRGLAGWEPKLPSWKAGEELATREACTAIARRGRSTSSPGWSAAAPTSPATPAWSSRGAARIATHEFGGRQIHFGIREHGMGAVDERHGGRAACCPSGGTFFVFSDYMRGAVRLAALSGYKVAFVWTHDSVGVGEDGPTHQPIEQLAAMRAMPGLRVIRPADANETSQAWRVHLDGEGPTALDPHPPEAPGARAAPPSARPEGVRPRRVRAGRRRAATGSTSCSSAPAPRCRCASAPATCSTAAVGAGRVDAVVGPVRGAVRRLPRAGAARRRARRSRSRPARPSAGSATPTTSSASTTSVRRRPGDVVLAKFGFTPENVAARAARCSARERSDLDEQSERHRPAERVRAEPLVRQPHPTAAAPAAGWRKLVDDDGIRGVTSNPTIFEKAMAPARATTTQLREVRRATGCRSRTRTGSS